MELKSFFFLLHFKTTNLITLIVNFLMIFTIVYVYDVYKQKINDVQTQNFNEI